MLPRSVQYTALLEAWASLSYPTSVGFHITSPCTNQMPAACLNAVHVHIAMKRNSTATPWQLSGMKQQVSICGSLFQNHHIITHCIKFLLFSTTVDGTAEPS